MTLESLKLWVEKDLLMDDGKTEYGFVGYFKGLFADNGLVFAPVLFQPDSMELQSAFSMLTRFLQSEDAYGILLDKLRMETFCRDRLHDHIPYSFNRECWGFRVLTDRYAWYLACTPWNEKREFTIYCYDRTFLILCPSEPPLKITMVVFWCRELISMRILLLSPMLQVIPTQIRTSDGLLILIPAQVLLSVFRFIMMR